MAKRDISELFGLPPTDPDVKGRLTKGMCPFVGRKCGKTLDGEMPSGVCAVSNGASEEAVIVCPNRLYGDDYATLRAIAIDVFGVSRFIVGGSKADLMNKLKSKREAAVVAFGHHSGNEIQVNTGAKLSFDWVLQFYNEKHEPVSFVAVEVQSMDTTGNYRAAWEGYRDFHKRKGITVPQAMHGINWANVHKRLLPQLIRKGNIVSNTPSCAGFFFVVPDVVYQRFEAVLGNLTAQEIHGYDILSVRTYSPSQDTTSGVRGVRKLDFLLSDVAAAYYASVDTAACQRLAETLKSLVP